MEKFLNLPKMGNLQTLPFINRYFRITSVKNDISLLLLDHFLFLKCKLNFVRYNVALQSVHRMV